MVAIRWQFPYHLGVMDEDWELLLSFFPKRWRELAFEKGALKGLRKDKSEENLLRTLLLHLGCGYSLRETVVRARKAQLADLSDVALLKRLKKSKGWLHEMCIALFQQQGVALSSSEGFQVRAFDATTVKEPGKTGSLWRIHYSVCLPSLTCDFFKLTETQGQGTGESFSQFPISKGDYIVGDRGYSTANGIQHVVAKGAHVTVRVNTASLPLLNRRGKPFNLFNSVTSIKKAGTARSWQVQVSTQELPITGRLCALRKSKAAIRLAQEKIRKEAARKGKQVRPETLEYAKYVLLFTTFPEKDFTASKVLEWYRIRWQVELVFKRFKSLAQLGHLPKHDDESAKAWLYGKLLVALLVESLIEYAASISPWGYVLEEPTPPKRVA